MIFIKYLWKSFQRKQKNDNNKKSILSVLFLKSRKLTESMEMDLCYFGTFSMASNTNWKPCSAVWNR